MQTTSGLEKLFCVGRTHKKKNNLWTYVVQQTFINLDFPWWCKNAIFSLLSLTHRPNYSIIYVDSFKTDNDLARNRQNMKR